MRGHGQNDQVIVNGTNGNDKIDVGGDAASGCDGRLVAIQHQEPSDKLDVKAPGQRRDLCGRARRPGDHPDARRWRGQRSRSTPRGEAAFGGDGNDSIDGNGGNDVGNLGAGDDTFVWDPGDGSDTVEGQDGTDTMLFNGANGGEQVDLSANGERLRFFRTQGTITMDTTTSRPWIFNALGGSDTVTVNDHAGTDVKTVNANLAAALGGNTGDGQNDQVIVNSQTSGNDAVEVADRGTSVA